MAGMQTPITPKTSGNTTLKSTTSASTGAFFTRSLQNRASNKSRQNQSSTDTGLFLKRVIGCSTGAFDSHPASRSFAYTAGAAAVVVQLDDNLKVTQRFFRARPNVTTWSTASSQINSLQNIAFLESRNRLSLTLKDLGVSASGNILPSSLEDTTTSKTWTARERIKAATCVSFSPDGKWLAVGEVRTLILDRRIYVGINAENWDRLAMPQEF